MLLLADGNLPTGSFVASSGFESYVKHGFFGTSNSSTVTAPNSNQAIANFIQDNLGTYSRSALPFVSDAYIAVAGYRSALEDYSNAKGVDEAERVAMDRLISLDNLYHSMTLNDVTRRASKSQGVALLTLFSKGFSKPSLVTTTVTETQHGHSHESMLLLVDKLKTIIRREDTHGHLPICWGVLTAALGLSLGIVISFLVKPVHITDFSTKRGHNISTCFCKLVLYYLQQFDLMYWVHMPHSSFSCMLLRAW